MNISEVVKKTGIPASTLRYYEEKGLIKSLGRSGLQRKFPETVIEKLALISLAQSADFSLDEISIMFGSDRDNLINRNMLIDKANQIDETIKRLTIMSDSLKHAAICKAPSHFECSTFKRLMKAALQGKLYKKTKKTGAAH